MHRTFDGIVDSDGSVRLLEPANLPTSVRVLVTVLEEGDENTFDGVPIAALLAEPALMEYWDRPEEDEAWQDLDKLEEVT